MPSLARITFRGRCPKCGEGRLFSSFLAIVNRCAHCGLSFAGREVGDGPAFIAILIIGTLAGIGAAAVEIKYAPPYWLHAAIWVPFIVLGSIIALRWCKAFLLGVQYELNPGDFK
jgi:uncharacterized protein (DUF983 family)